MECVCVLPLAFRVVYVMVQRYSACLFGLIVDRTTMVE